MYNKIASIILNSSQAEGFSDVFVAQPDSLKENLAGQAFILAEISGRRNDGKNIFDLLVSSLNDHYYNDDKILFRDKIAGLKIENIFEATLTKINKDLNDFLLNQKIKIDPIKTSITLGVIYENKIYFSSFGNNKALLIYKREEKYELINVETNSEEVLISDQKAQNIQRDLPKIFSSVISGEIPLNSYFIFSSETLPEYLSTEEIIKVVTKLPPISAAEQIKNILSHINNYVPFLGVIVKNTVGLYQEEIREELEETSVAQGSISSLNYTEAKTEEMLSPSGLISFHKFFKSIKILFTSLNKSQRSLAEFTEKYFKRKEKKENSKLSPKEILSEEEMLSKKKKINLENQDENKPEKSEIDLDSDLNLGKIKSLKTARSDSFLINEKIPFKKKTSLLQVFGKKIANTCSIFFSFFNFKNLTNLGKTLKIWSKNLNSKSRWLFISLGALIIIFVISLVFTNLQRQRQLAKKQFNDVLVNIENLETDINTHLLYNDQKGARESLLQAESLLSSLPQKNEEEQASYQRLALKLQDVQDKIEKIINIQNPKLVNNLNDLNIKNLVYQQGKIYGANEQAIYTLTPNKSGYTKVAVNNFDKLTQPVLYGSNIYYWNANNKFLRYNFKTKTYHVFTLSDLKSADGLSAFNIFYDNIYLLADNRNQIYRYLYRSGKYKNKTDWLKDDLNLNQISDLAIDGDIYFLKKDGQVLKFRKGRQLNYSSLAISPVTTQASKLILGDKNIYIFDPSSQRIIVLAKKTGKLLNQYQFKTIINPLDFSVDEVQEQIYVLNSQGIYSFKIEQ